MQTLQFHEKVGADGVLRLEVHDLPNGQEIEAVLNVQVPQPSKELQKSLDEIDSLYGSCAENPIELSDQGEWPVHEDMLKKS